jgi:alpha-ketoglutarate-dependent taurine dioxygenase
MSSVELGTMHRSGHFSGIEVLSFDAGLGAEVRCGDLRKLDDAVFAEIRKAWLDHLVLVFREQTLTDDDLLRLGARFGTLDDTPRPQPANQPGQHREMKALTVVSNVVENGVALGALGNGDLVWHTDMSYVEVPPDASVLYSIEIPMKGGETGFNNMYLALETLSNDLRRRISCKPEFAWYHKWAVGDVVLWDNRCTMHRRNAFDERERRIMHRTQIKGTRPYRDPLAQSRPPHPRGRINMAHTGWS